MAARHRLELRPEVLETTVLPITPPRNNVGCGGGYRAHLDLAYEASRIT